MKLGHRIFLSKKHLRLSLIMLPFDYVVWPTDGVNKEAINYLNYQPDYTGKAAVQ